MNVYFRFCLIISITALLIFGCDRENEVTPAAFSGDVILTTQHEVDSFGAKNYAVLNGSLQIGPSSGIRTLDALNSLTTINGNLIITQTSELPFIDGFNNLGSITDTLLIENNEVLINISGFNRLNTVGGLLEVNRNNNLIKLDGFSSLSSCEILHFIGNRSLENIKGFSNLQVLKTLALNNVRVRSLLDIKFLSNLEKLEVLDLVGNGRIYSLEGLENLKELKVLAIYYTPIQNLNGLRNLEKLESIYIWDAAMGDFSGLENITALNTLKITDDYGGIWSFKGLDNLREVEGDISMNQINSINIDALSNLKKVGGNLVLSNISNEDLEPLANLDSIGKGLRIAGCDNLTSLEGLGLFNATEGISINGNLDLYYNDLLSDISLLSKVNSVKGDLLIQVNRMLTDFCPLENLFKNEGIEGGYTVQYNGYNPTEQDMVDGNCKL